MIKVFCYIPDLNAKAQHRIITPYKLINKTEENIEITFSSILDVKFIKNFNVFVFYENNLSFDWFVKNIEELRKNKIKIIYDIDDYWEFPVEHPLYDYFTENNIKEKIITFIKYSDLITTTNHFLKKIIEGFNKNVIIINNYIKPDNTPGIFDNTKIKIGWIGGIHHQRDIEQLREFFEYISKNKNLLNKIQIVLGGFETKTISIIDNTTKFYRKVSDKSHWIKLEKIFTNNYSIVDEEYKKELLLYDHRKNTINKDAVYIRLWGDNFQNYIYLYNYIDISIIPLKTKDYYKDNTGKIILQECIFNKCKSNLKIIEASSRNKLIVAQDFGNYKETLEKYDFGILTNEWKKTLIDTINNYEELKHTRIKNIVSDINPIDFIFENKYDDFRNFLFN